MEGANKLSMTNNDKVMLKHQLSFLSPYTVVNLQRGFGCIKTHKGDIIFANDPGRTLQVFNSQGKALTEMKVSYEPQDLAEISEDCIAVSFGNASYFEIANIKNYRYEPVKVVDTGGKTCWGISYEDGLLAVKVSAFSRTTIQLYDTKAEKTKHLLSIDESGIYGICLKDSKLFCSNAKEDNVNCYDLGGNKLWLYKSDLLKSPGGIACDYHGNVFVVGTATKNLVLIAENGKRDKVIPMLNSSPMSVYFDKTKNNLLLRGLEESNIYDVMYETS